MFQSMVLMDNAPSEPNEHQLAARRMRRYGAPTSLDATLICAVVMSYPIDRST